MWNPFRKTPKSTRRELNELREQVSDLEGDVESLLQWRVKMLAKLRQRVRRGDDDGTGEAAIVVGERPAVIAPTDPNQLALVAENDDRTATREALRQRAKARGMMP